MQDKIQQLEGKLVETEKRNTKECNKEIKRLRKQLAMKQEN